MTARCNQDATFAKSFSVSSKFNDQDNLTFCDKALLPKQCIHEKSLHVSVHIIQSIDYKTHLSSADVE